MGTLSSPCPVTRADTSRSIHFETFPAYVGKYPMRGINAMKLRVLARNEHLSKEMRSAEALVRLMSGSYWAIAASIALYVISFAVEHPYSGSFVALLCLAPIGMVILRGYVGLDANRRVKTFHTTVVSALFMLAIVGGVVLAHQLYKRSVAAALVPVYEAALLLIWCRFGIARCREAFIIATAYALVLDEDLQAKREAAPK